MRIHIKDYKYTYKFIKFEIIYTGNKKKVIMSDLKSITLMKKAGLDLFNNNNEHLLEFTSQGIANEIYQVIH